MHRTSRFNTPRSPRQPSRLAFMLGYASGAEQRTRLRVLQALAYCYFGSGHPVSNAFSDAVANPKAVNDALIALEAAPSIQKRRLISTWIALMPRGRS